MYIAWAQMVVFARGNIGARGNTVVRSQIVAILNPNTRRGLDREAGQDWDKTGGRSQILDVLNPALD